MARSMETNELAGKLSQSASTPNTGRRNNAVPSLKGISVATRIITAGHTTPLARTVPNSVKVIPNMIKLHVASS